MLRPARHRTISTTTTTAAATLAALALLAGCSSADPSPAAPSANDAPASAPSDAGGDSAPSDAPESSEPATITVTAPPTGFTPPADTCNGEGMHLATKNAPLNPALPDRGGSADVRLGTIDGKTATLVVTSADGRTLSTDPAQVGDSIGIEKWTVSITSICADTQQVEFDLIN